MRNYLGYKKDVFPAVNHANTPVPHICIILQLKIYGKLDIWNEICTFQRSNIFGQNSWMGNFSPRLLMWRELTRLNLIGVWICQSGTFILCFQIPSLEKTEIPSEKASKKKSSISRRKECARHELWTVFCARKVSERKRTHTYRLIINQNGYTYPHYRRPRLRPGK